MLGGCPSGCMSLRVKGTPQLMDAQKRLNEGLYKKFGPCLAEHDDDNITPGTYFCYKACNL